MIPYPQEDLFCMGKRGNEWNKWITEYMSILEDGKKLWNFEASDANKW
jgi:hypothetical protein